MFTWPWEIILNCNLEQDITASDKKLVNVGHHEVGRHLVSAQYLGRQIKCRDSLINTNFSKANAKCFHRRTHGYTISVDTSKRPKALP